MATGKFHSYVVSKLLFKTLMHGGSPVQVNGHFWDTKVRLLFIWLGLIV